MGTKITATRERVFRLQAASEDDTIFLICNVLFGGRPDANRVLSRSWLQPGAVFKRVSSMVSACRCLRLEALLFFTIVCLVFILCSYPKVGSELQSALNPFLFLRYAKRYM